jgi:pyruvate,water dikinase
VSGTALADHYVLSRRGRIDRVTHAGHIPQLDRGRRRALALMARRAERVFGAPQDIEWLVDDDGRLWLLQSRPVTAVAPEDGRGSVLLGPGPLAETFPAPLRPLEEDLWIPPLRDGIVRALRTTGAVSNRSLERSPVVTTVGGWVAVDLDLIGAVESRTTLRRRINPAAMVRRLATAWRVGRLRIALPRLAHETVATIDRDLAMIPRLDELADGDLVDLLDRTRRELATAHAYEVLTGMLLGSEDGLSGAAMAVRALHDGRAAGWSDEEIVLGSPVVLALTAPRLGAAPTLPAAGSTSSGPVATIDHLGQREALRVRVRWLQELLARTTDELGRQLVATDTLPDVESVACLRLDELAAVGDGGPPPSDITERRAWNPGPPLPVSFRLTTRGDLRPASVSSHRRRASGAAGTPASGGRVVGVAHHRLPAGTPPTGIILVTRHLEPQLAPVLGSLTGLVSETGSALSHLAILAREAGLATVVGVPDALDRFPPGTRLMVDGRTGEVEALDVDPDPAVEQSIVPESVVPESMVTP